MTDLNSEAPVVFEAGNRDVFSVRLEFLPDPDGGSAASPEESASWGALRLYVRGQNLCLHEEDGEVLPDVHWYLLPFLEWLVQNWGPLLHESHMPEPETVRGAWGTYNRAWNSLAKGLIRCSEEECDRLQSEWYDWWSRHFLHASRQGGLMPDVCIRRAGACVEVSAGPGAVEATEEHVRFQLSSAAVWLVDPTDIAEPLYSVLIRAAEWLAGRVPDSCAFQVFLEQVRAISTNSADRTDWRQWMASGAGQDNSLQESLMQIEREHPELLQDGGEEPSSAEAVPVEAEPSPPVLMFGTLSPRLGYDDVLQLLQKVAGFRRKGSEQPVICDQLARNSIPLASEDPVPYQEGQILALRLLDELGESGDFVGEWSVDIDSIYEKLGIALDLIDLQDMEIRAIAIAGPGWQPAVVINSREKWNPQDSRRRFTLAHELCHLIHDRSRGCRIGMASGPWAPQALEQRANAFAAMLLMPPSVTERAKDLLSQADNLQNAVQDIARNMKVSLSAAIRHLANVGALRTAEKDLLEEHFHFAGEV